MKRSIRTLLAAVGTVALAAVVVPVTASGTANAQEELVFYAIDNSNRVVTLTPNPSNNNATIVEAQVISGLLFGDTVVGLDRSPHDGKLYAVGKSATATVIYTLDPATGEADPVAGAVDLDTGDPVILEGTSFGVDVHLEDPFISIVSNTRQNVAVTIGFFVSESAPAGFFNPGDSRVLPDTSVTGLTGSAYAGILSEDPDAFAYYTVSRNKLYKTNEFSGATTFIANLQSPSTNGFDAGLDSNADRSGLYSRTISTPSALNSSVYVLHLETGATNRLLTTPNGVTLREVAF